MARRLALILGVFGLCCGETDDALLFVDVRTDLAPGVEFDAARTEVIAAGGAAGRFVLMPIDAGTDGLGGFRAAELDGVPQGDVELLVSLIARGAPVASRPLRVHHVGRTAVTILIERGCAAVGCAAGTACYAGGCVDPRCTFTTPERCGEPACAADADCGDGSPCGGATCVGGACLYPTDTTACGAGMRCDPVVGCVPVVDAGGDGGADGGSPPDAGPFDETACDDIHAARPMCDGFETLDLGRWSDVVIGNGAIDPVTAPTYRGRGAARVRKGDGQTSVYLRTDALNGRSAGDDLYARWYLYIPTDYPLETYSNLLWMGEDDSNAVVLSANPGDELRLRAPPGSASDAAGPGSLHRDRWMCLEVHLRLGDGGAARAWLDGALVLDIPSISATPDGPSDIAIVGLPYSPDPQPPGLVFIDEFVASTTPIGCD